MTKSSKAELERKFQKDVLDYLQSIGGHWIKLCANSFQKEGEPDIVGCYKGRFVAFELKKTESARASALQLYKLKKIKENGGISMKVYDINQIKGLFDGWDELQ